MNISEAQGIIRGALNAYFKANIGNPHDFENYESFERNLLGETHELVRDLLEAGKDSANTQSHVEEDIYEEWNKHEALITHRSFTGKMRGKVRSTLKDYTEDEIAQSIQNYAKILEHPDRYFFQYKWTLHDFLQRGLEKFLDWDVCDANFRRNKINDSDNRPQAGKYENM